MWFSGALSWMSSSPCTSPKSLSMLVLKVPQTSLLSASALSQCAMRKQAFYWRALLRWIKRKTKSLNLRPLKFSFKIVLNDHRAQPCSVFHPIHFAKQPCRQYTSSDIPFAHSMHLAFSRCLNMSKCVKPGCGYLCITFSVIFPFPIKPPASNTDFPLCVLGHSPCEEFWLGRESGQSPAASLVVVFGAGFSSQDLLCPEALPCCGN